MNISRKNLGLIATVIVAVVGVHLVTVAIGQPGPRRGRPQEEKRLGRWLGLSRDQSTEVLEAHKSFRLDMRKLQRRIEIESLELAELIEADQTTDEQLKEQFKKLSNAHVAVHNRVAELVLAVRPHLDAEQRVRFNDMISRHFRSKHGRGDRGGRRGPGGPEGMHRGPGGERREFHHRPGGDGQMPRDGRHRSPMGHRRPQQGDRPLPPPPAEDRSDPAQK